MRSDGGATVAVVLGLIGNMNLFGCTGVVAGVSLMLLDRNITPPAFFSFSNFLSLFSAIEAFPLLFF